MENLSERPLGQKAYGHIPHLPGSRMGAGDHHCHEGQHRICCIQVRDKHDRITVQEKVDGSCVSVTVLDGQVIALGRSGYTAQSSPYEQHQLFAYWVRLNADRFRGVIGEGERIVGEWLAQAHGTRYELPHEPFVAFDIFERAGKKPGRRLTVAEFSGRVMSTFVRPRMIFSGHESVAIEDVLPYLATSGHGAIDPVEGAVWRVERNGEVDFLAKWVRPTKVDGCYLPDKSNQPIVWNWRPSATPGAPSCP
jgi:hypothetical protein